MDIFNEVIVVEYFCNVFSFLIKLIIKCKNINIEENLSFIEKNIIDVLGIGMFVIRFDFKITRIFVFRFFLFLKCGLGLFILIFFGKVLRLCNFDIIIRN